VDVSYSTASGEIPRKLPFFSLSVETTLTFLNPFSKYVSREFEKEKWKNTYLQKEKSWDFTAEDDLTGD